MINQEPRIAAIRDALIVTPEPSWKERSIGHALGDRRAATLASHWSAWQWSRRAKSARRDVLTDKEASIQSKRLAGLRRSHDGERCVIIGNGPSLNKTDVSLLQSETTFGANRLYLAFERWGFATTYTVLINRFVAEQSGGDIAKIGNQLFTTVRNREFFLGVSPEPIFLFSDRPPGFYGDVRWGIWEGATVTYVSMQLAYHLGFRDVVLVGVDHRFTVTGDPHTVVESTGPDPNHFDPSYFGSGYRWQLPDLGTSEYAYRLAGEAFARRGGSIVDASVDGALEVFPKVDLAEALLR